MHGLSSPNMTAEEIRELFRGLLDRGDTVESLAKRARLKGHSQLSRFMAGAMPYGDNWRRIQDLAEQERAPKAVAASADAPHVRVLAEYEQQLAEGARDYTRRLLAVMDRMIPPKGAPIGTTTDPDPNAKTAAEINRSGQGVESPRATRPQRRTRG